MMFKLNNPKSSNCKNLYLFTVLTVIWGSSFFFTKLALVSFNPVLLVQLRSLLGALTLFFIVKLTRQQIVLNKKTLILSGILGAISITIPFILVTFAQLYLPSSTTTVLTSTTPLFVFIFATALVRTEKPSLTKITAIVISFTGAVILGLEKGPSELNAWWVLCVLLAAALYAASNIFTYKYLSFLHPVVLAYLQVTFASIWMLPVTTLTGSWYLGESTMTSLLGVLELGILASGLNYIIFSRLIREWGSTVTSLNTYLQPVVGILLGVLVLNETITGRGWLAVILLFVGVVIFGASTNVVHILLQKRDSKNAGY